MLLVRRSTSANYYDAFDEVYRASWGLALHHGWFDGHDCPSHALRRFQEELIERLHLGDGSDQLALCDVGCGYNTFAAELIQRSLVGRATGITNSRSQADFSNRTLAPLPELTLKCRDWLQNGLPDAAFHRLVAVESLYHFQGADRCVAIEQMSRILRPGGRAVLTLWLARDESRWCAMMNRGMRAWDSRFGSLGQRADSLKEFSAAGLRTVSVEDITSKVRPTLPILYRRVVATAWEQPSAFRAVLVSPTQLIRAGVAAMFTWLGYASGALRYVIVTLEKP